MKPNDKAIEAGVKLCWDCPRATPSMIRDILTAAYAAQFPPSEDYAGLVNELRKVEPDLPGDRTRWYRNPNGPDAADALEALLAERDALKAENESMRQSLPLWAHKQMAANNKLIERLRAERDALLARFTTESALRGQLLQQQSAIGPDARLAPVDDKELVEIAADAIDTPLPSLTWEEREGGARAAITAIRPHIEAAEREQCVTAVEKVAERINVAPHERPEWEDGYLQGVHDAASAIRSGK